MVAFGGLDVPESHFELCRLKGAKVHPKPWQKRLPRAPLSLRLEWALTADALEPHVGSERAERLAFRSIEPEPTGGGGVLPVRWGTEGTKGTEVPTLSLAKKLPRA